MIHRRHHRTMILLTCLSLAGVAADAAAQDPELIVEIEKQEIFEGESVLYRVTLNHAENPTAPVLDRFDDFQVTALGAQSLDSRQIRIINGRRSEIVRRGRQYNYRLTPLRSGTLTIPAPTAEVDGEVLTGRTINLRVIPPDAQDAVILDFTSDRKAVYPMQPFALTLTIAVKDLPGELKDRDPLSVQPQPPALEVPWLADDRLPEGIEPEKSWREILEPLISRQGNGVQVNNIGTSSVFSLFEDRATGFRPQPKRTTRTDASGADAGYWEYRFQRRLIPRRLGVYRFGPVTLKGTFADRLENGKLAGRQIYALAAGLEIVVNEVPRQGRPDSYIGAVGRFNVQAELAPTTAQVGDPMTLTLTLSGQGTLADARPPAIAALPGVQGAFRTYDATEESRANARKFTYSLRPLSTEVTEFPALPVSFFDVEAEKYVTRKTEPIPVSILAAEVLSGSEIVSAPTSAATSTEALEASAGGIFANDANLGSLRNEAVRPGRWLAAWAGMLVVWGVVALGTRGLQRIRENPTLLRRRSAPARARAALENAAPMPTSGSAAETCASLRRAVTGLIADFANVPEAGLTPRDAADRLAALGVEQSLGTRTEALLNACAAARYGAAADDVVRLHRDASNLVAQLITELGKSSAKHDGQKKRATTALLVLGLFFGGCGRTPGLETSRKFQDAEKAFSQATSVEDFARVARQYDQIGDDQFVSAAVLYNQGNAWMRAAAAGRAIAAYRQAQRYRPRDPYLAANLQNALAASGHNASAPSNSGVAGYVFFWQNWLSYPEKFVLTTLLLAMTLSMALLSQWTSRRVLFRRLALAFGALGLVAIASTGYDWRRFDGTTHGVVTADQIVARKGNSETYEVAFTEPLSEGTEFVVLEQRNDWLHVQIGDAGTGWLRQQDVETY